MTDRVTSPNRPPHARLLGKVASLGVPIMALVSLGGCIVALPVAPPSGAAPGYGYTCYAGVYVCRLPQQIPAGTQCSCPGIGAPSFGSVR